MVPRAHRVSMLVLPVLLCVVAAGGGQAAAATGRPLSLLPATRSHVPNGAHLLGAVSAGARLPITFLFKPRHPELLAGVAARSQSPLSPASARSLFAPTAAQIAAVRSYFEARGFSFQGSSGLAVSFTATSDAVHSALGVSLDRYRALNGRTFYSAGQAASVPAEIAPWLESIGGLSTATEARPLSQQAPASIAPARATPRSTAPTVAHVSTRPRAVSPNAAAAHCLGATNTKLAYNALLPVQLASTGGYDAQPLVAAGYGGYDQTIAFLEYSNYYPSDVNTFKKCFGISTPVYNVPVNGGTSDYSNNAEDELDVEEALGAAPHLAAAYMYTAQQSSSIADIINQVVADQPATDVHVLSISWGLCEPAASVGELNAEDSALQLAAASGISVYVAAGDSGSADCDTGHNSTNLGMLAVDDPGSQPYATAVGGTHLNLGASGASRETVWNDLNLGQRWAGGGGVSQAWTMPGYQSAVLSPGTYLPCGSSSCRAAPDIALNADVYKSPFVIYTCQTGAFCGASGWSAWGGTSGAAPLMAGYTADINEYSTENGGDPLGFANPLLYSESQTDGFLFRDITSGNNDISGGSTWSAASGYDVASGLGSPDATELGIDALNSTTTPTVTHGQASASLIRYGKTVTLTGTVTQGGTPIQNGLIWLVGHTGAGYRYWSTHTNSSGAWRLTLSRAINQRFSWYAQYQGEAGSRTSWTPTRAIAVIPKLSASAGLKRVSGIYHATARKSFAVYVVSSPAMAKAPIVLQARRRGGVWRTTTTAKTNTRGRAVLHVHFSKPGRWYLRWAYHGGKRAPHRWASATSPALTFAVH